MAKIIEYFKETKEEFKHVTWPSRMQTTYFTVAVIVVSVLIAYYLGLFDAIFKMGLEKLLNG